MVHKFSREGINDEYQRMETANFYRKFAVFAILLNCVFVIISTILIPSLYGYMQRVESQMQSETDYCKSSVGTLWQDFIQMQLNKGIKPSIKAFKGMVAMSVDGKIQDRIKRQAGYENSNPSAAVSSFSSSEVCSCQVGLPGDAGEPGIDGKDGKDGLHGTPGRQGKDAPSDGIIEADQFCFDCPVGPPGPVGKQGPKGPNGKPGSNGNPGKQGQPGKDGPQGPVGPAGDKGSDGNPGAQGVPGVVEEVEGPVGAPGAPGEDGAPGPDGEAGAPGQDGTPGPQGPPGDAGKDGAPGQPGTEGSLGESGPQGNPGSCDACAIPRTAPGY